MDMHEPLQLLPKFTFSNLHILKEFIRQQIQYEHKDTRICNAAR